MFLSIVADRHAGPSWSWSYTVVGFLPTYWYAITQCLLHGWKFSGFLRGGGVDFVNRVNPLRKFSRGVRSIFFQKIIFIQFFKLEKEQYYDLKRNYVKTFYFWLNFIGDFVMMERKIESLYFHTFTTVNGR